MEEVLEEVLEEEEQSPNRLGHTMSLAVRNDPLWPPSRLRPIEGRPLLHPSENRAIDFEIGNLHLHRRCNHPYDGFDHRFRVWTVRKP